ncbi:uncharacterized protein LOC128987243 isoform X1 [Macrosteles quadrilineatus]|uniref:uncharacterized protein LOC128987243 isoform X1 n=1 Tax=Macrosteles quadrilineatus TaxID=74068 RepID=UPI0023E2AC0C|nr:uncharacterized protein LOC128987243 isoform X1 [Macrosteles quadrilineatus]
MIRSSTSHYCGRDLSSALSLVCQGWYKRSDPGIFKINEIGMNRAGGHGGGHRASVPAVHGPPTRSGHGRSRRPIQAPRYCRRMLPQPLYCERTKELLRLGRVLTNSH